MKATAGLHCRKPIRYALGMNRVQAAQAVHLGLAGQCGERKGAACFVEWRRAMESSSARPRQAATAQLSPSSSTNSAIQGQSSNRNRTVSDSLSVDSSLSAIKLRSLVAWARLESSSHRGRDGEGSSARLDALDSLAMRFKFEGERIDGVQGASALRPRARVGSWSGAGNDGGIAVGASAGRGVWHTAKELLHLVISLGAFIALDKRLKNIFLAYAISFPSALFGMFLLFLLLTTISAINTDAADNLESFFSPANLFIQRWLPLFYVPSLVVVPLALKDISAGEGASIGAILVGGWMCTLLVTGYTTVQVRKMVKTELLPADPVPKAAPFTSTESFSWVAIMLLSFCMALRYPSALGPVATTAAPFLLAATVVGYVVGTRLPAAVKKFFHPMVACILSADLGAYALGIATGKGFKATLGDYMTKSAGSPGAGDILNGFLGSVILSFAFSIYRQRKIIQRHASEITTAVVVASVFSMYSTASVGRLLGLLPSSTSAIIPHCVTVALALPIAKLLEGKNPSLTAAAVVLTGLTGANFAQVVMDKFGFKDPIARGMATAASAHGLGTAALSRNEPEALPYCAISYSLTGIVSTVLCSLPPVRSSLLTIAGTA